MRYDGAGVAGGRLIEQRRQIAKRIADAIGEGLGRATATGRGFARPARQPRFRHRPRFCATDPAREASARHGGLDFARATVRTAAGCISTLALALRYHIASSAPAPNHTAHAAASVGGTSDSNVHYVVEHGVRAPT